MDKPTKSATGDRALPLDRRPRRADSAAPHLYRNRHGTFYFRIRFSGSEFKRSLGTKDRNIATMLAAQLNHRLAMQPKDDSELIAELLAKAQAGKIRPFDVKLPNGITLENIKNDEVEGALKFVNGLGLQPAFLERIDDIGIIEPEHRVAKTRQAPHTTGTQQRVVAQTATPKFLDATEAYLTQKGHESENREKTIKEKRATYKRFIDLVGAVEVGQITKEHAVLFKQQLMTERLGTVRINKLLSYIRDFLNYAVGNITGIEENVFEKTKMSSKKKTKQANKTKSYLGFTREELDQIFAPDVYKVYCRGKRHYYWMPLLCLLTGARPDEIASLPLSGVQTVDGVEILDIEKAKNGPSIRKVPIHASLIEGGFLDYVRSLRESGEQQLFPELKDGANGFIKNVSRRFNQDHLDEIGITNPRKRLYSFRSTVINRLTELNWNPALIMAVVGHYEQEGLDLSAAHFQNYQGDKSLSVLRDVVNSFDLLVPIKRLSL